MPGLVEVSEAAGPVAALCTQWRELVRSARYDGARLGPEHYLELRYEDVVQDPAEAGRLLTDFVGLDGPVPVIDYLVNDARSDTVGNWRRRLTTAQVDEIRERLNCEMALFGIDPETGAPAEAASHAVTESGAR